MIITFTWRAGPWTVLGQTSYSNPQISIAPVTKANTSDQVRIVSIRNVMKTCRLGRFVSPRTHQGTVCPTCNNPKVRRPSRCLGWSASKIFDVTREETIVRVEWQMYLIRGACTYYHRDIQALLFVFPPKLPLSHSSPASSWLTVCSIEPWRTDLYLIFGTYSKLRATFKRLRSTATTKTGEKRTFSGFSTQ